MSAKILPINRQVARQLAKKEREQKVAKILESLPRITYKSIVYRANGVVQHSTQERIAPHWMVKQK